MTYRFIAAVSIIVIEGRGFFAHAKYRRKRGPAYIAFFLFFFFSMADQRFRGIPPISSPSSTHDSRANKFLLSDPFCIKVRCCLQEGKGYSKFGIGIKGIRNFALATVTAEN